MSWLERLEAKSDDFIPSTYTVRGGHLPRTRYPYGADTGEGLDSNVIMAPVSWVMTNFTEADLAVTRHRKGVDRWDFLPEHPAVDLIERPNDCYSGELLWKATVLSYLLDGNAYWYKVRNRFGEVVALWYLPHMLVEPMHYPGIGEDHIGLVAYYRYRHSPIAGVIPAQIAPRDIIHFRYGLDPRNPRLGFSRLKPLLREVFTDDEAANFAASILRNMGVPGGIISPKDAAALPGQQDIDKLRQYLKAEFTGDNRGDWLVTGQPTEISQFGFNPQNLMLSALRDISEERVCAMLGVQAAIVGFGSGMQQTKVGATMRELVKLSWVSGITPMQNSLARELNFSLLPEFTPSPKLFSFAWDSSKASAFTEDEDARTNRVTKLVLSGMLRVDRGQAALGLEVDETQAVYLRPSNVAVITEDGEPAGGPAADDPTDPLPDPAIDEATARDRDLLATADDVIAQLEEEGAS